MNDYYNLVQRVLKEGFNNSENDTIDERHRTLSLFGERMVFDCSERLPVVTRKKVNIYNIVEELNWFLRGSTNANELKDRGVNIWNEWADHDGELGPVYGAQWLGEGSWKVNQIMNLIRGLKEDPSSRRHIVSAWNVADIDKMALPPCHMFFQCYVSGYSLDMQMYQRSADLFLGVPYNITSYAILLAALADACYLHAGKLTMVLGDAHIYHNHIDQCERMLRLPEYDTPRYSVEMQYTETGNGMHYQALPMIEPYRSGPFIPADVTV